MSYDELSNTIDHMLQPGKGILAADESNNTIAKRLANIHVENSELNRRNYRQLLATTPSLGESISSVILFEETFMQHDDQGVSLVDHFNKQGIIPGIKVDKGLIDLANTDGEKVTEGLDGLVTRLLHFKDLGARFAKWRNVYSIADYSPSLTAIKVGAENLARYAAICHSVGIVPIVEPEVLIDGDHSIDEAAEVSELVLHELFKALFVHHVELEHIILKPSMITCGKDCALFSSPEDVADYTLSVFRNHVPAAVPGICFLSGGQSAQQATVNLNAINSLGNQPWILSFSYGRALQDECLQAWGGKHDQVQAAQKALLHRAEANSKASLGNYDVR